MTHYNGEPLADPGKLIRLTLRGHYVRWRIDSELARSCPSPEPTDAEARWRPATDGG